MEIVKKLLSLKSSANPEKISASLKGIIGVVATLAAFYGVQGAEEALNDLLEAIMLFAAQLGTVISSGYAVFGVVRRIINLFNTENGTSNPGS